MVDKAAASNETPLLSGLSSHTEVAFMSSASALRPNPRNHGARWGSPAEETLVPGCRHLSLKGPDQQAAEKRAETGSPATAAFAVAGVEAGQNERGAIKCGP